MKLFDETINGEALKDKPIMLLLNKTDLLEKKLKNGKDLSKVFKDYEGKDDVEKAKEKIRSEYMALNKNGESRIHPFFLCALKKEEVKSMFVDVKKILENKK